MASSERAFCATCFTAPIDGPRAVARGKLWQVTGQKAVPDAVPTAIPDDVEHVAQ